jgi:hypothetical protein
MNFLMTVEPISWRRDFHRFEQLAHPSVIVLLFLFLEGAQCSSKLLLSNKHIKEYFKSQEIILSLYWIEPKKQSNLFEIFFDICEKLNLIILIEN